ncbi:MAG: hypothetical protein OXC67_10535 [Flavobacteriaceae bacterium]|nr:hypothetical protein [Flavobacteriaceae bacterium]
MIGCGLIATISGNPSNRSTSIHLGFSFLLPIVRTEASMVIIPAVDVHKKIWNVSFSD